MNYQTVAGDVLDAICAKHYGDNAFDIRKVLEANPGLAAKGPVYPARLTIVLPDRARLHPKPQIIRLVD